jgi:hypothetical protein
MTKIPKTRKTILKQRGVVSLVHLERPDCSKPLFGVTAPQNVGHLDGLPLCEQFMTLEEAQFAFERYCKYFESRDKHAADVAAGKKEPRIREISNGWAKP